MKPLLEFNHIGIFCRAADVYIDPWRSVPRALITHAHGDHARFGMGSYLAQKSTARILQHRLGASITAQGVDYGEQISINGVHFSFHPAGHVAGSSQIRVEHQGEVWVASGDYKVEPDGISESFAPLPCHTFITESTFGLPIFKWRPQQMHAAEINDWWRANRNEGKASVLLAYSLGKAQRVAGMLDTEIGPIFGHGAVQSLCEVISGLGYPLPVVQKIPPRTEKINFCGAMILAPPSAAGTPWMKRFNPYSLAAASGWMMIRGIKRRRGFDRGFAVSDHADFEALNETIAATGAEKVFVTHGYTAAYARWLRERGYDAEEVQTEYKGEVIQEDSSADAGAAPQEGESE